MNLLISHYVRDYKRISIISDYKSEEVSNILYYGIIDTMKKEFAKNLLILDKPNKFHIIDEFNDFLSYSVIIRRTKFNSSMNNIDNGDGFLIRTEYFVTMDGNINDSLPRKILYNSDLIITLVNNKLSITKDRHGDEYSTYNNMDVTQYSKGYKINKILKRINE